MAGKKLESTLSFDKEDMVWIEAQLVQWERLICAKIKEGGRAQLIVFELGHFQIPIQEENLKWALCNVYFVDRLVGRLIERYQKEVKFLAILLVNNLEDRREEQMQCQAVLKRLFAPCKYLSLSSLRVLSERNLKNRAYKMLKKERLLKEHFIHIGGKVYLQDSHSQEDLAVGFVDKRGRMIPRCGLILSSFLERVAHFAAIRMYPKKEFETLLLSFSQEFFEYQRVKLGVDIYAKCQQKMQMDVIVSHWDLYQKAVLISYKKKGEKSWKEIEG